MVLWNLSRLEKDTCTKNYCEILHYSSKAKTHWAKFFSFIHRMNCLSAKSCFFFVRLLLYYWQLMNYCNDNRDNLFCGGRSGFIGFIQLHLKFKLLSSFKEIEQFENTVLNSTFFFFTNASWTHVINLSNIYKIDLHNLNCQTIFGYYILLAACTSFPIKPSTRSELTVQKLITFDSILSLQAF